MYTPLENLKRKLMKIKFIKYLNILSYKRMWVIGCKKIEKQFKIIINTC